MANLHSPKLSAAFVKGAKPGRYTDGHGLMLWVKPTGTRSWVQRLIIQGKRRDMGLGAYPQSLDFALSPIERRPRVLSHVPSACRKSPSATVRVSFTFRYIRIARQEG